MVHDNGAHADESPGFHGAPVNNCVVSDACLIAYCEACLFPSSVKYRTILDIDTGAESYGAHISAHDRSKPKTAIISSDHVSDNGAVGGKPVPLAEMRFFSSYSEHHSFLIGGIHATKFGLQLENKLGRLSSVSHASIPCPARRWDSASAI